MCESRLFGSERGQEHNCDMDKALWHRPESRRPTESTNIVLKSWKSPAYSKPLWRGENPPQIAFRKRRVWDRGDRGRGSGPGGEEGNGSIEEVEIVCHGTSSNVPQSNGRRFESHCGVRRVQSASLEPLVCKCPYSGG
jgi:hypothetical protein